MTEQRVQRRLAAILAADVVGYSALMQRAEEATYAEFERLKREVIEPGLSRHDGRLIKTTGDGALAEFASPSAAVRCAVEMQESIASGRSSLGLLIALCASADAANSAFALSTGWRLQPRFVISRTSGSMTCIGVRRWPDHVFCIGTTVIQTVQPACPRTDTLCGTEVAPPKRVADSSAFGA